MHRDPMAIPLFSPLAPPPPLTKESASVFKDRGHVLGRGAWFLLPAEHKRACEARRVAWVNELSELVRDAISPKGPRAALRMIGRVRRPVRAGERAVARYLERLAAERLADRQPSELDDVGEG